MLGLTLRKEFQGRRLKGTAIELSNEKNTGATQIPARDFLEITYPTGDVLTSLEAIGPGQGRPVVLIGERGQGKSHLMGAVYHALTDANATRDWLLHWADRLKNEKIASLSMREGMLVITESLHRQRYKFLWDLLFDNHPHGGFIRGKWEGAGDKKTDIPPDTLILELLRNQPTALILDEFQTWFDGLTNTKQYPWRNWAFNFIQVLSEIAKDHPELLVLVVSVRNGQTDAYQQIHRVNPVRVDFKGADPERAQRDRRRLLLHRLFEKGSWGRCSFFSFLLVGGPNEEMRAPRRGRRPLPLDRPRGETAQRLPRGSRRRTLRDTSRVAGRVQDSEPGRIGAHGEPPQYWDRPVPCTRDLRVAPIAVEPGDARGARPRDAPTTYVAADHRGRDAVALADGQGDE